MLSTTAKYIYAVYRLKSVSLAAQTLFISQPALSRAIKKAETELGSPIFNRKTLPFSLTPEGKLYIDAIEKILQVEKDTAERLSDIKHKQVGMLRIGISRHLSFYLIPKILKEFHKSHPHVDIHIVVAEGENLQDHLSKETADLVFISGGEIPDDYISEKILEEKIVVAMPENMVTPALAPYAVNHNALIAGKYEEIIDTTLFEGLEFIYSTPNSNIQKKRKILFGKNDIPPYITANAGRQQLNFNLMRSGFGALLTSDANIATMPSNAGCSYFVLGVPDARLDYCIVYPQEHSQIVYEFAKTAKELFSGSQPLRKIAED